MTDRAERSQIEEFDASYCSTPPWDIGRSQPAFVSLAEAGSLFGKVLDIGCGTGEHALLAASRGHEAVGIDSLRPGSAVAGVGISSFFLNMNMSGLLVECLRHLLAARAVKSEHEYRRRESVPHPTGASHRSHVGQP